MRIAGLILETVGTVSLLLAVNVVRDGTLSGANVAAAALVRWRDQLIAWVQRRWRKWRHPNALEGHFASNVALSGDLAKAHVRSRVDRATISDRDWLEHLDDVVHSLRVLWQSSEDARARELRDTHERIERERDKVLAVMRQGWQYAVAGATLSIAGIILTALA